MLALRTTIGILCHCCHLTPPSVWLWDRHEVACRGLQVQLQVQVALRGGHVRMAQELRYLRDRDPRIEAGLGKRPPKIVGLQAGLVDHGSILLHHIKDRSWLEDKIYSKETGPGLVLGILRNLSLNLIRGFEEKKCKSLPKRALHLLLNPSKALKLLMGA